MRKYIRQDLIKYIDLETLRELERAEYSQKADRILHAIFSELIQKLKSLESEISEQEDRIKTLSEALSKQKKILIRKNEAEDREKAASGKSRDEKIVEMYQKGYSQRQIAHDVGVSQQRVKEIIKRSENPLISFCKKPENFLPFSRLKDPVVKDIRNQKICEWRDLGYTQKQIAEGVGLSRSRVAEIVSEKCTQVQKTDKTIQARAKKNGVHRNTQAKLDRIRSVAPWLADQCESGQTSVRAAWRQVESVLGSQKGKAGKDKKRELS